MLRRPEPATKMTAAFVSLILLASALPSATGFATTARALPRLAKQRATEPAAFLFEAALADCAVGQASLLVSNQRAPAPNIVPAEIEVRKALAEADVEADADSTLWPWQVLLLGITAVSKRNTFKPLHLLLTHHHLLFSQCWGANFAATKYAIDALGGTAADGELFVASRFVVAAALLVPFLASASNRQAIVAGVQVGGLCALGYAAQALALGMGTSPGTAAFICSLQSVVVALMARAQLGRCRADLARRRALRRGRRLPRAAVGARGGRWWCHGTVHR